MARFSVDTHLFRELGELLVGRDSTALIELVKNAYDADATSVTVFGENLDQPDLGRILIADDGNGMTPKEFEEGFLRVASRLKDAGSRTSPGLQRRYLGAKGIGRLAAHKLASLIDIQSTAENGKSKQYIQARIDWDVVEESETLDKIDAKAITLQVGEAPAPSGTGTILELKRLRKSWTARERDRFLTEVESFEPPEILTSRISRSVITTPLLFEQPIIREVKGKDPGFDVLLQGDFETGDSFWTRAAESAHWVIEIEAGPKEVTFGVAPTRKSLQDLPEAGTQRLSISHPEPKRGPHFYARIFVREGQLSGTTAFKSWARQAAGIRVFLEGFRVLPYGEPANDWLSLDADYTRRSRTLEYLDRVAPDPSADRNIGLVIVPNRNYFGGVFLTEEGAPSLRLLVNREGFIPDATFDTLVDLVRIGIDLSVRVRAAAGLRERQARKERRRKRNQDSSRETPAIAALISSLVDATTLVQEAQKAAKAGSSSRANAVLTKAASQLREASAAADELASEEAMLRVLASVGTQMASFVHEMNILLEIAQSVDRAVLTLSEDANLQPALRTRLKSLHSVVGDLRRSIERNASYLTDVTSADARRRRRRLSLSSSFDSATQLIRTSADRQSIKIENQIPAELRSSPMFPAELASVFSNLLTNAVKAAGRKGRIRAHGLRRSDGSVRLLIENTGESVKPEQGERWFRPFESSTTNVDAVLGQGMGLGLTITRRILEEYGVQIRFARPSSSFAAALELLFPGS